MKIMLACAAGMSTSLLVRKMREYCVSAGKDYKIWAVNVGSVENEIGNFDILLLGPQVISMQEKMKKLVGDRVPVEVIPSRDYGLCKGDNVVRFAEKIVEEKIK